MKVRRRVRGPTPGGTGGASDDQPREEGRGDADGVEYTVMKILDYESPRAPEASPQPAREWLGVSTVLAMGLAFIALLCAGEARQDGWRATAAWLISPVVLTVFAVVIFVIVIRKARRATDSIERLVIVGGLAMGFLFVFLTVGNLVQCSWYAFTGRP